MKCVVTVHYSTVKEVHNLLIELKSDYNNSPFLLSSSTSLYLKLDFFSGALSDNQNHPQVHRELKQVYSYQFNPPVQVAWQRQL